MQIPQILIAPKQRYLQYLQHLRGLEILEQILPPVRQKPSWRERASSEAFWLSRHTAASVGTQLSGLAVAAENRT